MKISKLFHWLYAFVMFLPIIALGSSILISTFNMSSKEQSEIVYKYETNELLSSRDLVVNNIYHLSLTEDINADDIVGPGEEIYFRWVNGNVDSYIFDEQYDDDNSVPIEPYYYLHITEYAFNFYAYADSTFVKAFTNVTGEFDLILYWYAGDSFDLAYFSPSTYNVIESVETHNLDAKEVFYDTLDELKQSPYFSWAYNSFLAAPLVYIVGLFSVPTNHIIVMFLSYWLAISIIWLVFDLIMYVPLLVHRWIDKGMLE